jgi:DNA-directed RNA polymerase specialized sigma subunit
VNRQQTTILKVPEKVALERSRLETMTKEMEHELGRSPSDMELTEKTGISPKRLKHVRSYKPAVGEGQFDEATGGVMGGVTDYRRDASDMWRQLVYDELVPQDQLVMQHAFGLNGHAPLQNQEIAAKLKRSPGLISQRKLHIQKLLDREQELSPFGGGF